MPFKLPLRSLTRLVVGGVLSGIDLLSDRLETWEEHAAPPTRPDLIAPDTQETAGDRLSYALIGMLFASQDRLVQYARLTNRATRLVGDWADLISGSLSDSRLIGSLRHSFDSLSDRGAQVVNDWMMVGRAEAEHSRRLAELAITERVDQAIDYLTTNQEVQELIQSQSAGLIDEVIEEARERTVSADNFLEAVVRSMLRRPPRWELPGPPPEVRQQAEAARQAPGRRIQE